MHRRSLLALLGAGTLSLAGCTTSMDPLGPAKTDLPEDCPKSQNLDVEWPDDLNETTAKAFLLEYENAYYREVVVEYEPESKLEEYGLDVALVGDIDQTADGWTAEVSGGGGIYQPTLSLTASTADPPEGADVVPVSEFEDDRLVRLLEQAAESGEAEDFIDNPGPEVDRYVGILASASEDFEWLEGPGDSDSLYVDVDGTTVKLTAQATNFHGDYMWNAWYYVDEHVVRRSDDENTDPRNGNLLECRQKS